MGQAASVPALRAVTGREGRRRLGRRLPSGSHRSSDGSISTNRIGLILGYGGDENRGFGNEIPKTDAGEPSSAMVFRVRRLLEVFSRKKQCGVMGREKALKNLQYFPLLSRYRKFSVVLNFSVLYTAQTYLVTAALAQSDLPGT